MMCGTMFWGSQCVGSYGTNIFIHTHNKNVVPFFILLALQIHLYVDILRLQRPQHKQHTVMEYLLRGELGIGKW